MKTSEMTNSDITTSSDFPKAILTYWPAITFGYLSLFILGLYDNLRGPFFVDISNSLNISDTVASLFFVITSGVAFILGLLSASILSKVGLVLALRLSLLTMGAGYFFISVSQGVGQLLLGAGIFGIGFGITNVAQNLIIIEGASEKLRRKLLSGLHATYALAAIFAPILAEQFFRWQLPWQKAFQVVSLISLLVVGVSFLWDWPSNFRKITRVVKSEKLFKIFLNLRAEKFLSVSSVLAFYVLAEIIVATRLSVLLRREYEFTAADAARCLTGFFLCLLFGRLIFLFFHFRHSSEKIIGVCLFSSIILYLAGSVVNPLFFIAVGLTMGPVFGLSVDLVAERFKKNSSEAVGLAVTASGALLVPVHFFVGYLSEKVGIKLAVGVGVVPLIISGICLWQTRSKKM